MITLGLNNPLFRLYLKEIIKGTIKYLCTLIFNAASSIIEKEFGNDDAAPQ